MTVLECERGSGVTEEMTRREFVKAGAVLGGGLILATSGGCTVNARDRADVETPSATYGGGGNVSGRILVGYATRTGSTTGVAEAIGETLAGRGFEVDLKPMRENPSLAGYDGVVLGSAINGAAWLPEAMSFVRDNRAELEKVPVAAFCVHAMNLGDDEKAAKKRHAYLSEVRSLVKPSDEAFFAGVGPSAKDTSFIARWAFRAFGGGAEGDCRDWDAIHAWAGELRV